MEGTMAVNYRRSTRTERSAEVTLVEVTIGALLAALDAMVREGMPEDAEVTFRRNSTDDAVIAAFSAVETPAQGFI
jgi:hypothetical protein